MSILRGFDCLKFLSYSWRGILALCDDGKPYAFPVAYILHGESLYFLFSKYGRKINILKKNPHACYIVYIEEKTRTISIIIEGILEHVNDLDIVKQIVHKFVNEIIPRDPYFKSWSNRDASRIISDIISGSIPGIFRLNIESISCMVESHG